MQINQLDATSSQIKNVKQRFFALRNGVIADALRKNGSPYRIIFGLNLPQLQEIAEAFGYDMKLANDLWQNLSTRESRLLAPMLVDPEVFTIADAEEWIKNLTESTEDVDVLCHKLLRKTNFTDRLIERYKEDSTEIRRYLAIRLSLNTLSSFQQENKQIGEYKEIAEKEIRRGARLTKPVATQLLDEIDFLLSSGENVANP